MNQIDFEEKIKDLKAASLIIGFLETLFLIILLANLRYGPEGFKIFTAEYGNAMRGEIFAAVCWIAVLTFVLFIFATVRFKYKTFTAIMVTVLCPKIAAGIYLYCNIIERKYYKQLN